MVWRNTGLSYLSVCGLEDYRSIVSERLWSGGLQVQVQTQFESCIDSDGLGTILFLGPSISHAFPPAPRSHALVAPLMLPTDRRSVWLLAITGQDRGVRGPHMPARGHTHIVSAPPVGGAVAGGGAVAVSLLWRKGERTSSDKYSPHLGQLRFGFKYFSVLD